VAGGVAAGKQFAIRVVLKAFEDGGQCLHHLLQLDGVLGFAGEVFLFTGIPSEVIELVGPEGILVVVTGARDAAAQAGQLPEFPVLGRDDIFRVAQGDQVPIFGLDGTGAPHFSKDIVAIGLVRVLEQGGRS
jgi:hypothetical protein